MSIASTSIASTFDNMASHYDVRNQKLSHIRNNLHHLVSVIFAELPENANILCVGAGTGEEILYLAEKFPKFRFTAVDPAEKMLDIAKQRLSDAGFIERCTFHAGYLDSLGADEGVGVADSSGNSEVAGLGISEKYDGATSILVSQFILDKNARCGFFKEIKSFLKPSGLLVNVDLSSGASSDEKNYDTLLKLWVALFNDNKATAEQVSNMKNTYSTSVGVLPTLDVEEIIKNAGFSEASLFFQSLLIHGWVAR